MNISRDDIKIFLKQKFDCEKLSNIYKTLKKYHSNIYDSIINITNYLPSGCKFNERLYHILNNLYSIVLCKECNNSVAFTGIYTGYRIFCSTKCATNSDYVKAKFKETCLKKYNVDNPFKSEEIKEEMKKTNLEKYGVEYASQSNVIKQKKINTFKRKYNVEHQLQIPEVKLKVRNTHNEIYGGIGNASPFILEKYKNTCNEIYGGIGNANPFVLEKYKNTSMEKYGEDNIFKTKEFIENNSKIQKQKFKEKLLKILENFNLEVIDIPYQHASYRHLWRCTKCGAEFNQIWNEIQQGFLCPTCFPRNNGISLQEKEVLDFIKELLLNEQIIENSRKIIPPKELDIYIPSKNIAIEFNGLHWHSEEKLQNPKYHLNKTLLCDDKNIKLIHIFEDEWIFKQDIVKYRLKNILGISTSKRIHARQCTIKEIGPKIKNEFLNKFHIQGEDKSVIKLGAFYNNKLISVMTFSYGNISKGSKSKTDVWELNRFCSNYDYHIPGIASKILTYFKNNYKWKEIFSYADLRWSNGNLYNKLGFNYIGHTGINYWYIKDYQRIHRFNLRKNKNDPKDIPEWILRQAEGYHRIWDCGSLKYELKSTI